MYVLAQRPNNRTHMAIGRIHLPLRSNLLGPSCSWWLPPKAQIPHLIHDSDLHGTCQERNLAAATQKSHHASLNFGSSAGPQGAAGHGHLLSFPSLSPDLASQLQVLVSSHPRAGGRLLACSRRVRRPTTGDFTASSGWANWSCRTPSS